MVDAENTRLLIWAILFPSWYFPLASGTYRFARIMPTLLLGLAIIVPLGVLDVPYFLNAQRGEPLPDSYFWLSTFSVLTFWHNVLMQVDGWFNYCMNVYWSLSVEEVFYLALPVAFLALRRTWAIVAACVVLIVIAPIYRGAHADEELYYECGYLACFDAIALGCLTALLAARHRLEANRAQLLRIAAGLGIVVFYLRGIGGNEAWGFTCVALCTALYLFASVGDSRGGLAAGRATGVVRWLGRHSYELYLFHIIVLALMRNVWAKQELPPAAWTPWLLLYVGVSALAAMLVSRYVSEPANRAIRNRATRGVAMGG